MTDIVTDLQEWAHICHKVDDSESFNTLTAAIQEIKDLRSKLVEAYQQANNESLVTRLREHSIVNQFRLTGEAATEIERLQNEAL